MKQKQKQIVPKDETVLKGAKSRFGRDIPVYDDGYGPLWIHRESMGVTGIIRALTWYDAYEICEDEFFESADMNEKELVDEYGENWSENACFNEAYGFRPNGGMYAKDLNGDTLEPLTPELLRELGMRVMLKVVH